MKQCATVLSHSTSAQWILAGDIKSCFDTISHAWLLTHIPMDKAILNTWLKAGYMDKSILYETEDGTPQGGIIEGYRLARPCQYDAGWAGNDTS